MSTRLGVALLFGLVACVDAPSTIDTVTVTVPRGATLRAVAESLASQDVVESASLFRFYATLKGQGRAVQAGTYDVPRNASIGTVLSILVAGRPAERRLTIAEGLTLVEIGGAIEAQLGIPAESVLAAARDDSLGRVLRVRGATLEGYLYPSSYLVPVGASARDVVRQMVVEFQRRWNPAWDARLKALGLSPDELVTLASIIEGEVRYPPDRRYVSSVYHNRLALGMRLQADPTVIYALGRRRRLFERDYQTRSPYNTYRIDGLPPGPIGSPSDKSLEAAIYPARSPFLYFVARPDGKHVFSRTYAEHLRTIREVRSAPPARREPTEASRR
ncbi:MAG: endolytic transglycosylase MltG [Gemmatimonadota bacterium]|nr:endolytic transglycosylase MltG [Gemmatimonadota bacterium]MDH3366771.1 endolytic transglycosylase MltG [Gemmatimonadota bacterium]MDH3479385.1 endolytic transglycosylase MltG [Gemmatimonadota bacterium]MDH5548897.1 endolytic transglycosylase MltG [Gemmatimonadota bacterium]